MSITTPPQNLQLCNYCPSPDTSHTLKTVYSTRSHLSLVSSPAWSLPTPTDHFICLQHQPWCSPSPLISSVCGSWAPPPAHLLLIWCSDHSLSLELFKFCQCGLMLLKWTFRSPQHYDARATSLRCFSASGSSCWLSSSSSIDWRQSLFRPSCFRWRTLHDVAVSPRASKGCWFRS